MSREMRESVQVPKYMDLQTQLRKSFTASADFLPLKLTYWCCPTNLTRVTIAPSKFAAHPAVTLAVADKAVKGEDLPLVLPYTRKGAPGISVCREEWDAEGIFEVDYYQGDSYNQELCFTKCAVLKCQVVWDSLITFRSFGNFQQNSTRIGKSDCLRAAETFVQLLNIEFNTARSF